MDAYDAVLRQSESNWLSEVIGLRSQFLGTRADAVDSAPYADYRFYFDDAGCIRTIAQGFDFVALDQDSK